MSNDNKMRNPKKGLPGGIFLFVLAIILILLTVQNLSNEKLTPRISFSHQLEHLVNLDLIQKDDSRKTALNDNLVTFSGQFKEHETDEGKARFRYLELLNQQHVLEGEKERINTELNTLQQNVKDSADWFLHLSGLPLPRGGYRVVDPVYNTLERDNAVVIRTLSDKEITSLKNLENQFSSLQLTEGNIQQFNEELATLVQGFRSPALGIGNEAMKQQLKTMDEQLAVASHLSLNERAQLDKNILSQLKEIVKELDAEKDNVRLLPLRSVRNYKQDLEQYNSLNESLDKNTAQLSKAREAVADVIWFFNNQELSTRALEKQNPETFSQWFQEARQEWENFSANRGASFRAPDQPRTTVLEKTFKSEEPSPNYFSYFLTILPVVLVMLLLYFVFSRQMKGVGTSAMNFGKSPAKLFMKGMNKVTFKDVAGIDEAREELQEIVDFLKDPGKFTALGAQIPKGVLCIGAPGTGKTLIARAVAGEADRPFFLISGSDFVEMFVGVGASRIRSLFEEAKKHAPCIIFIDEIDAVGRHRGAGIGGGHDEREQTLNQLLVEMDGFDPNEGVILIAATNRPDVLDKALLRPGRFDRRIIIDLPDIKGRLEILKVHARKIKLDPSVDLSLIARNTAGASGADLKNILNEAALLAARKGRSAVTLQEALEACDKVRYGKERRSLEIDQSEKRTTAIHESGHTIVGLVVNTVDPVDKVTIVPRGLSLGATHFLPKKNRLNYWRKELLDQLAVLMGGRVAEEIFLGDLSSGAAMDIAQATKLARSMVCEWGMTELGAVAFDERSEGGNYLGLSGYREKNFSESTAQAIDEEVAKIVKEANQRAHQILQENREKVQLMTEMLILFEVLDRGDIEEILNGTWNIEKKQERLKQQADAYRKLPPPPPTIEPPLFPRPDDDRPLPQQI